MKKQSKIKDVLEKLKTRGYTQSELKQTGIILSQVRKRVPRGWILFEQRNNRNEQVYCLFRKNVFKQKIAEKDWDFHTAKEQPYIAIQLPNKDCEKIKIFPIGDIHLGAPAVDMKTLRQDIEWIKQSDNVYVILMGDLIEMAHRNSVGSGVYEQKLNPDNQVKAIISLLSPIAHKILFSVGSNHENRVMKMIGIDIARMIADKLQTPYFKAQCFADILWKGQRWTIHAQHGSSGSQTKGGRLNSASRPIAFTNFTNFYIHAHLHDKLDNEVVRIVRDPVNMRLVEMKQYVVITSSYMRYFGTYAEEMGYALPSKGRTVLLLFQNGNYHASS